MGRGMATAIIEIDVGIPGATGLTLDLYPHLNDTVAVANLTLTEQTNRKGVFRTTTTAALTGLHRAEVKVSTTLLASGYVVMSDTATVHLVGDTPLASNTVGTTVTSDAATVAADILSQLTELNGPDLQLTAVALGIVYEKLCPDVDGYDLEQTLRLILSAVGGLSRKPTSGSIVYRAADDSKDRITAIVLDGERTAITLDPD
jgi:predicted naringenin-chalcone synthase